MMIWYNPMVCQMYIIVTCWKHNWHRGARWKRVRSSISSSRHFTVSLTLLFSSNFFEIKIRCKPPKACAASLAPYTWLCQHISKRSFTDAVPVCSLLSTIFISPIAFDKRTTDDLWNYSVNFDWAPSASRNIHAPPLGSSPPQFCT